MSRWLFALLLIGLLGACAARPHRDAATLPPLQLSPASLGAPLSLQQQLTFRFGRIERRMDALLEADATQVQLLVQAMGQTGFRVQWDGAQLQEQRAAWLPRQVRAERVLDDLQFALWPTDAIAAALVDGWQLRDDGHVRRLQRDGVDALRLRRNGDGSLQLDNLIDGYALTIRSVQSGDAP